jgi:hypothetical protein
MFIRFRNKQQRLQVSLIETRRSDGKVRHEHIASFGSVPVPPTADDRFAFWKRLHERLARLSNRVDAATQGKLLGDIHARIPMVSVDEQRDVQLRNDAERFWAGLTKDDIRHIQHCERLNEVCNVLGFETVVKSIQAEQKRAERRCIRIFHRFFC